MVVISLLSFARHSIKAPLAVVLLVVTWGIYGNEISNDSWSTFLSRPTRAAESSLLIRLRQSRDCRYIRPDGAKLTQLVGTLAGGESLAIRPTGAILSCIDGGELEDAYRALGKYISTSPEELLRAIRSVELSSLQVGYMATMLPLSFSDNVDAQIAELERRRSAIGATSFAKARQGRQMLRAIAAAEARLREVRDLNR